MSNDLDEKDPQGLDLQNYLRIVRRRHLYFLIPLFIGWAVVWSASWLLHPLYQSSTLILVEQPTMPKNYVTPNVSADLQERLRSITQQILSRTRLLRIIDEFGLYSVIAARATPDEKVERMRKDIAIDLVRGQGDQITAFNVSYTSGDPRLAQRVTGELTNLFINENLEVRQQQSEDTTKFLEDQLDNARKQLAEQENRVREFKSQHVGEMPEQLASNLQILGGLQSQLQNQQDSLNAAKQQRVYLQTLADQSHGLGTSKGEGTATVLPTIDQELEKLRAQLADLSSHYTERHPDVRKLKEQIAKTEKIREQVLVGTRTNHSDDGSGTSGGSSQRSDLTLNPASAQLQSQLQANRTEIANRENSIGELTARIESYQARLNEEPIREQQLADLTRGYDQSKATYDDLLKKKNESAMATRMEIAQQGERFTVVDPPSLPEKPSFPNRLKFCGLGVAFGLALGALVAGLLEMKDDCLHNEKEIKDLLPAPILTEIPVIANEVDVRREKIRMWLGWATTAVVVGAILAGSAVSYLRG
jgi:polysaccharide chain length determinant protein (PEP-CTERM system associated)